MLDGRTPSLVENEAIRSRKAIERLAAALIVGAVIFGLSMISWFVAAERGTARLAGELEDRLTVSLRSVQTEIERFRYLPAVISRDERVIALLRRPANGVAPVNAYLQTVRAMSGVDEIYVLDTGGLTLASSNWNEPGSFVGNRYDFRPYFTDAMATGEGRYYAVGVTTGKPGYFLSSVIGEVARPLGVVVAKVDMAPLAETWSRAGELTAIADSAGVVFLSGAAGWHYRPLYPLDQTALADIAAEQRYHAIDIAERVPIGEPFGPEGTGQIVQDGQAMMAAQIAIEPDGWTLVSALPMQRVNDEAQLTAGLVALACLLTLAVALFVRQRGQIARLRIRQNADLEQRVAERTAALAHEVEVRTHAETTLRGTQDSLIHAARLAALGRMSAAIVHEVSQPLSALDSLVAAAGLHSQRSAPAEVQRTLASARALLGRMQRMVKHLKTFSSRRDIGPPEPIDCNGVVEEAMAIVEPRTRERGVRLIFSGGRGLPEVAGNPIRIEQALVNLLTNAIDATSLAGHDLVSITTGYDGGSLVLQVIDSGSGISEQVRQRMLEPFFTTKATGEGLGLGLAITQLILEESAGSLVFETAPDGGTVATVRLPAYVAVGDRVPA